MTVREQHARHPILVTGMPRSGTTWVARMLWASGLVGYINEPFNLAKDPGTLRIPVDHWFPYITAENEHDVFPALTDALEFRYPLVRELKQCRTRSDLVHTLRWWWGFVRSRGRRPLVKEPHAVFSIEWFSQRLESDVVITVRHPVAVVSSWNRLGWSFDFGNLVGQPALVRDWLGPFERQMRAALEPSADRIDRVALLWHIIYRVVDQYRDRKTSPATRSTATVPSSMCWACRLHSNPPRPSRTRAAVRIPRRPACGTRMRYGSTARRTSTTGNEGCVQTRSHALES
jgi:hypothetical protein